MVDQTRDNNERIQAAVELELERRALSKKLIWFLLALTLIVAILLASFGTNEQTQIRSALSTDPSFAAELADSQPLRAAVAEETLAATQTELFAAAVSQSQPVQTAIDVSTREALRTLSAEPDFLSAVAGAVTETPAGLEEDVRDNRRQLEALERRLSEILDQSPYSQRIDAIEARLAGLSPPAATAVPEIAELEASVRELRRTVADLGVTLSEVQKLTDTHSAAGNRGSYLLKENARNALSDVRLTVLLGSEANGELNSVSVIDENDRTLFASSEAFRVGESFEFSTDDRRYRATLAYAQSRFLARDYIGLELTQLSP